MQIQLPQFFEDFERRSRDVRFVFSAKSRARDSGGRGAGHSRIRNRTRQSRLHCRARKRLVLPVGPEAIRSQAGAESTIGGGAGGSNRRRQSYPEVVHHSLWFKRTSFATIDVSACAGSISRRVDIGARRRVLHGRNSAGRPRHRRVWRVSYAHGLVRSRFSRRRVARNCWIDAGRSGSGRIPCRARGGYDQQPRPSSFGERRSNSFDMARDG